MSAALAYAPVPAPLTILDPPPGTFRICWHDGTTIDFAGESELEAFLKSRRCTLEGVDWVVYDDEGDSIGCVEEY